MIREISTSLLRDLNPGKFCFEGCIKQNHLSMLVGLFRYVKPDFIELAIKQMEFKTAKTRLSNRHPVFGLWPSYR